MRPKARTPQRRLLLVAPLALVALAACGDDPEDDPVGAGTTVPGDTLPTVPATVPPSTTPPSTSPAPSGEGAGADYEVATGADDVVISIGYEGGFVPAGFAFTAIPQLLVTGDGHVITVGAVPAIYPGPFKSPLFSRTITADAVQDLLALADDHGLLADVEYARNDMIADAADTVVTITVGGTTYEHRAYALGMDAREDDPARAELAAFVAEASDLAAAVGEDALGAEEPYVAEHVLFQAMPVDPEPSGADPLPTVIEWPADAPVRPADAAECASVTAAEAETLFADANQATYFLEGDQHYQLFAVDQIPGRSC